MQLIKRTTCVLAAITTMAAVCAVAAQPAMASSQPTITAMSAHRAPYWGGSTLTITGANFTNVQDVVFGGTPAWSVSVRSSTKLVVMTPYRDYSKVEARVVTATGVSPRTPAAVFTFASPGMNDPIQGGLTGAQEQRISANVRFNHRNAVIAPRSARWTAAMGLSAVRRAASWIGLPYSWAGGNGYGPTTGVCAHNGGDLDCHVVGFDCSGLTLYSWWPYEHLVHYAATQYGEAGRFHPTIGELTPGDLVYFSSYIAGGIGHTAIYAGNGMVIQAPESGSQVMRSKLSDVIAANGVYRGATRPLTRGAQGSGPNVSSMTSSVSTNGGRIVITGSGLAATTSVLVGGTYVYQFVHKGPGRLVLDVPAHGARTVSVVVSNSWGNVRLPLTYVAAPQLAAMSPSSGSTDGGTTVTVYGRNLSSLTTATVDGQRVAIDVSDPSTATITMPSHAAGPVPVVLASPYGTSQALTYLYETPTPPTDPPSRPPTG